MLGRAIWTSPQDFNPVSRKSAVITASSASKYKLFISQYPSDEVFKSCLYFNTCTRSREAISSSCTPTNLADSKIVNGAQMTNVVTRQQQRDLDERAAAGETVVPGGTGGKSFEAQQRLSEGRHKGGEARKEQLGKEGYSEMGTLGGLSSSGADGATVAKERGVEIDASKFEKK